LREKAVLPKVTPAFDNNSCDWNAPLDKSSYKRVVICLIWQKHRGDMGTPPPLPRGKHRDYPFRAAFSRWREDMKNSRTVNQHSQFERKGVRRFSSSECIAIAPARGKAGLHGRWTDRAQMLAYYIVYLNHSIRVAIVCSSHYLNIP
jgi:hypothetical protein